MAEVSCLVLFVCSLLAFGASETIYTNDWAVEIDGGLEDANRVASRYGFVNMGMVGSLESFYHFRRLDHPHRTRRSSHYHTVRLTTHFQVKWAEQQKVKKRVKRDLKFHMPEDPWFSKQWYLLNTGQSSGPAGLDHNVLPVWRQGVSGKGVVVSILDDGIEHDHPDLKDNYDPHASNDVNGHDPDPQPRPTWNDENRHGTRCAGEVAAAKNNNCVVGVAFSSKIGGVRMLDGDVTDLVEGSSLGFNPQHIDIYSSSWGPDDDGRTVDGPAHLARKAFVDGVTNGRGGLGSIFMWASGNGGRSGDCCNCDGYTNSIYTLSISSATDHGQKPWYLERCSSTLATIYSSGSYPNKKIITTDLHHGCTDSHTGTSASAPMAAGIMALALEVNPNLTWRDAQHIVIRSCNVTDHRNADWVTNAAGRKVSHTYGYGIIDALQLVNLARSWVRVPEQHICELSSSMLDKSIPGTKLVSSLTTDGCNGSKNEVRFLEHVQARVTLRANRRGSVALFLTSPQGTKSQLLHFRSSDTSSSGFGGWPFMSTHCWEENPNGEWKLEVQISGHYTHATLVKWDLVLHGTKAPPQPHSVQCDTECENGCKGPDATQCNQCKNFDLQGDDGKRKCVANCPSGLYGDRSRKQCLLCDQSCSTCHGPMDSDCLTCVTNRTFSAGRCIEGCPPGSFPPVTGRLVCSSCDRACAECVGPSVSACTRCNVGFMLDGSKCTSQCPDGTFAELKNRQCLACNKHCLTCDGAGESDCKSCQKNLLLVENTGQCVADCSDGYYQASPISDGLFCRQCDSSCDLCSDGGPGSCLTCRQGLYLSHNECVAVCPSSTFAEERACKPCHHTCSQCHGPGEKDCNTCTNLFFLNGMCLTDCPEGYYGDYLLHGCGKCDSVCRTCNGPSKYNCTDCRSQYVLQSSTCNLNCSDGFYRMTDVCVSCHEKCATCDGPAESNCLSCSQLDGQLLYLESGHCVSSCLSGHYKDNGQSCLPCATGCSKCFGPSKQSCSECEHHFYLDGYECVKSCPVNTFSDGLNRKCIPCSKECATCHQTVSQCTSCRSGLYLSDGNCVLDCPDGTFADESAKTCSLCAVTCAACSYNASLCTRCTPPFLLDEHSCSHTCPDGKYADRQMEKCLPCSHECSICTGQSSSHCLQCSDGYFLHITSCISTCPNHTFVDGKTASCVDCHPSCVACIGPQESNCTVCSKDLTLAAGRCVASRTCPKGQYFRVSSAKCESCDPSCKTCDGEGRDSCLTCPSGLYLDTATTSCNANCPDYFYGDSSYWVCTQCHSTCKTCSGPGANECSSCDTGLTLDDDGTCRLSCEDGYFLDNEADMCTLCDPICILCVHQSDYCLSCNPPYALLNTSCVSQCPVGMTHDETRHVCEACGTNCLQCDNSQECRECTDGMFLLHGECVSQCPQQTVGNMTTRQCVSCPEHCQRCSDQVGDVACTECDNGYHKLGDIECIEACPAGYFLDYNKNECHHCHISCLQCAGAGSDDCLVCAGSSTILSGSQCVKECPLGTFNAPSKQCLPCDIRCTRCFGTDSSSCTECTHDFFLVSTNGTCVSSCPLAFYPDRSSAECKPCHSSCLTCEGPGAVSCLSCVTGLVAYMGECLEACPHQTYEESLGNQQVCRACHRSCSACSGPEFDHCSQCPHGSVLSKGTCRSSCSAGFYLDAESKRCNPCHKSCQTCDDSSQTSCLSCPDSVLLVDGRCEKKCSSGYFREQLTCRKCDDSCVECSGRGPQTCSKCPTGKKLVEGQCLVVCSAQEYRLGNSCLQCHLSCATCSNGSAGGCLSCRAPKLLHHVRLECLPCCLEIQIRSKSESCCDCHQSLSKCILASENSGSIEVVYTANASNSQGNNQTNTSTASGNFQDTVDSSDQFMVIMGVMIGLIAAGFVIFLIVTAVRRKSTGLSFRTQPRYHILDRANVDDMYSDMGTA